MSKLREYLSKSIKNSSNRAAEGRSEFIGSVFFTFISLLLTAVNIVKHVELTMTVATSILTVGFVVAAVLSRRKILIPARILIVLLCGAIFTMFALIGGNDGFAILWILLVPVIGSLWVGLEWGVGLSLYFQIFLVVLFYTPLSETVKDYYSPTFMLRFPLLYLASFGAISFLMWQREGLFRELHIASYYDALTGLHNRRYFNDICAKINKDERIPGLVIFSFDLNRLKYANDTYGHTAGDELLQAAAGLIRRNIVGAECFRTGGDEFMAIAYGADPEAFIKAMKEDASHWSGKYMPSIAISAGYACAEEEPEMSLDELIALADKRMYADKSRFYKESGLDRRK